MKLRTELALRPFDFSMSHKDKIFFIGSCFAENIGNRFLYNKFNTRINPFGILYHPLAIKKSVDIALNENFDVSVDTFQFNELWSHFDSHSKLSRPNKNDFIDVLQKARLSTKQNIESANFIFITLGTAWVYRHIERDRIVANCHKLPQKYFSKELLTLEVVQDALSDLVSQISKVNPEVKFIFTLSPVRHLKDGFVNNQLSKSILHLAIQSTVNSFKQAFYFPSYELLLDDLRDYRFYKNDLLHPNDLALDYIWSKVNEVFFRENTRSVLKQIDVISKRLNHRFFNPESEASIKFNQHTERLIQDLENKISIKLF
ncbi:GSCFA domain-containing protein [Flavobacteriaceae bacterium 14752]|uniref:GSCFA domain-containing protein n=1 Tax=Mesohalobacter salilacus TaxID=2491711 RepID=UPI000F641F45|nr:GSCFA domain-containing protein [Flavobacteriaceae bacterium 14752]